MKENIILQRVSISAEFNAPHRHWNKSTMMSTILCSICALDFFYCWRYIQSILAATAAIRQTRIAPGSSARIYRLMKQHRKANDCDISRPFHSIDIPFSVLRPVSSAKDCEGPSCIWPLACATWIPDTEKRGHPCRYQITDIRERFHTGTTAGRRRGTGDAS